MTTQEIKNRIETETGLKVSVSNKDGYVVFSAKKTNGVYPEWSIEFARAFRNEFPGFEPKPTFTNKYQIQIFKQWYSL